MPFPGPGAVCEQLRAEPGSGSSTGGSQGRQTPGVRTPREGCGEGLAALRDASPAARRKAWHKAGRLSSAVSASGRTINKSVGGNSGMSQRRE